MSVEKNKETAREKFTPKIPFIEDSQKTNFFMKNKHFNKTKTYLKGKEEKELDLMSYRNINLGGVQMQLHKGVCLSKDQLSNFKSNAKEHWLNEKKGTVNSKEEK